MKKSGKF